MSGREGGSEAGPCDGGVAETQQLLCSIQDRDVSVSSPPPVPSERLLTLAVAEFLGTTFLVYFGCMNATLMMHLGASKATMAISGSLSWGLAVMMLVYSLGPVSGAHLNPVVSLTAFVFYGMKLRNYIVYTGVQFLGGIVGAGLVLASVPGARSIGDGQVGSVGLGDGFSVWNAFVVEFLITFFLVFIILNVAWRPHTKVHNAGLELTGVYVGIVIGLCITCIIISTSPVGGACMNPARFFGPALVAWRWDVSWMYLTADPLGALLAGLLHSTLFSHNRPKLDLGV